VRLVARVLRDAGMEVIYLGMRRTSSEIVTAAVQEDATIIGLSVLSGIHITAARSIMEELVAAKATRIPVVIGGIIPPRDVAVLEEIGIAGVFGPGSRTDDLVASIHEIVNRLREGVAWTTG
jgi:methylmalonyl-CoA mutase C-terminal domain/subunit